MFIILLTSKKNTIKEAEFEKKKTEKHVIFLFVLISFIGYKVFNKSNSKRIF